MKHSRTPFNRTNVELKQSWGEGSTLRLLTFNRTNVELKLENINTMQLFSLPFNRTNVELKQRKKSFPQSLQFLLIELM